MSGLMEQIKPENKRPYIDTTNYPLYARQTLASNIIYLHMLQGQLTMKQFNDLTKLAESEDIESVNLCIYLIESVTNQKHIL